jgi:hypothetical protein
MDHTSKTNTDTSAEIIQQTVEEIISTFKNRSVLLPQDRKNHRHVDRFPNHQLGNYKVYDPTTETPKTIDSEGIKQHLYTAFTLYKKAKNIPELIFPDNNKQVLENICKYIAGEEGIYDLKKGLYFFGRIGSGKTDLCLVVTQMVNILSRQFSNLPKYKIISYDAIYNHIYETGSQKIVTKNLSGNIYLDDLFYQDKIKIDRFKNEIYVGDIIITKMYELHQLKYRHIITSNYPFEIKDQNAKDLKKTLHPTSFDRMKEMFNFIFWDGQSLRR